ncbi:MAG TPA: AI-2E family transporter [Acidobacteriota bacterium]|nr:AI-2E family transporter [Acidobacteriota bacterium]
MGDSGELSRSFKFLLGAAAFVIVVAGIRAAAPLLVPLLLSIFLAVLAAPVFFWLKHRRVPVAVAVSLIVFGFLGLVSIAAVFVGNSLNRFVGLLPTYEARLSQEFMSFVDWLSRYDIQVSWRGALAWLDAGRTMGFAADLLTSVGGVATNFLLVLLTVIFILLEASGFPLKIRTAFSRAEPALQGFEEFARNLNRYIGIKTLMSLLTGVLVFLWTRLLGVEFALLWGLLAFVLNYIPNLGSIFASLPAILIGLLQHGWQGGLLVASGYLAINLVVSNLLEPRLMGRGLGLSPLMVFVSLVVWGWLLGPMGFILSVPLTMTLKIAFGSSARLRWIAVLLGPEVAAPQEHKAEAVEVRATRSRPALPPQ